MTLSDKKIFEKIDLPVKKIAEMVETTPATVYRWKNGDMKMNSLAKKVLLDYIEEKVDNPVVSTKSMPGRFTDTPITLFDWSAFLAHKKLTQMELAEVLDVKQPYISQMKREFEKGRPVPEGLLDRMREVFDSDEIEPFVRQSKVKSRKDGTVIDIYQSMRPYYDIDFFGTPGAVL